MAERNPAARRLGLGCLVISASMAAACGGAPQFSSTKTTTAANLTISPTAVNFGNVAIGSRKTSMVTLSNASAPGSASGNVTQISISGKGFTLNAPALPLTLGPGQSTSFSVAFAPTAAANHSGQLSITFDTTTQPQTVALSGTGQALGQLAASPSTMNFGTQAAGSNQGQTGSLSAIGADVTVSAGNASGLGFSLSGIAFPVTITAGKSVRFKVVFSPQGAGSSNGKVSFASNASNSPTIVNLTGAGSQPGSASLTVTPTALSFGNVAVGSRKSSTVRLINAAPAGSANGTVTQVSVTGNGFNIAPPSVPFTLDPGQSASFTITFAPAAATADSGQLTVTIQGVSQPEIVTLSGIGVASAQLGVNPSTMNFGTVTLGNSQTLSGSLAAAGMDVVINSINLNSQDFVLSGLAFPVTIVAGSKVPFSITFTPQSAGSATAQLAFVSNSLNSAIVDLSGTGAQASQHSVSLSWNASTSQVSGYNVYRSAQSNGTFNKLNSSLIKLLSFTDTNVQSGSTYYYAVTAVDSNNNESPYSNVATAVIP